MAFRFSALLIACLSFSFSNQTALATAQIEWEVVQPFRFFRYESDHFLQELAYQEAQKSEDFSKYPVSAIEALLNDPKWWTTPLETTGESPADAYARVRMDKDVPTGRGMVDIDPRLGWGALLRNRDDGPIDEGTCWDARRQTYENCISVPGDILENNKRDYTDPRHHIVRSFITTETGKKYRGPCNFFIEGPIPSGSGILEDNSTQKQELREIALESCSNGVLLRIAQNQTISLAASMEDNILPVATISVKDFLIVSMGDSFASGEGNPDLIAKLDPKRTIKPRYDPEDGKSHGNEYGVPRRLGNRHGEIKEQTAARWLDRRCHRSIYSAHTRAAIALALSGNRQHAVTYITTACSGAEITDGLFWPQDGRECTQNTSAGNRYLEPQIGAVVGAIGGSGTFNTYFDNKLSSGDPYFKSHFTRGYNIKGIRKRNSFCDNWPGPSQLSRNPKLRTAAFPKGRNIDLVLLSIGGNDMGFAPLVKSTIINSGATGIPFFNDLGAKLYKEAAGGINIDTAKQRIMNLDLRFEMLQRALQNKLELKKGGGKVLLTLYPSPAYKEPNEFCAPGRKGMNVSRLFELLPENDNESDIDVSDAQKVIDKLNGKLESLATKHGWTPVSAHLKRFAHGHGICAQDNSTPKHPTAEIHDLPHRDQNGWQTINGQSFHPVKDYYPYVPRKRWFRTMNDSYMMIQYFKGKGYGKKPQEKQSAFYLAYRSLGGPFHPTAEGHAVIADAIYCAALNNLEIAGNENMCGATE